MNVVEDIFNFHMAILKSFVPVYVQGKYVYS